MRLFFILLSVLFSSASFAQTTNQQFITDDIEHFWNAYEKIRATSDSAKQYQLLQALYLDKGTEGLKGLLTVRRYTDKEFIDAIRQYPKFWASIKANTLDLSSIKQQIASNLLKLNQLYPPLKQVPIYFSVGAFRTSGTIEQNKVLIGSELALADEQVDISEFPAARQAYFKDYQPRKYIALLCTHEYIHTQQKDMVQNLLSMCLYEGVAEYISCLASGKPSNSPAIPFGKANHSKVVKQFTKDLFVMHNNNNWLWGENRNELNVRDLGYYIGYAISERYYKAAKNKRAAIQQLIELDYTNEKAVEDIVNASGLLPKKLDALYQDFEKQRPTVISIQQFANGSQTVPASLTQITLNFSEAMDKNWRGFDYGPLGESNVLRVKNVIGFSEDGKSFTFEVELKPGQRYQSMATNRFRNIAGIPLKPYLIDITTDN